jgi:hypothetical protein
LQGMLNIPQLNVITNYASFILYEKNTRVE